MADGDAEADGLERLEAALDRIAARGARPPAIDTGAIAVRLDRLIARLRDALSEATSSEAMGGEA